MAESQKKKKTVEGGHPTRDTSEVLMTATMTCPDEKRLQAFCSGALSASEIEAVASHVEECEACQSTIERVGGASRGDVIGGLLSTVRNVGAADYSSTQIGAVAVSAAELSAVEALGRLASGVVRQVVEVPPPARLREYELRGEIGRGGMGRVYRALHTRLNREVALKILSPRALSGASSSATASVARFDGEMRALGQLNHPNIVQATDAGEVDGVQFLVMELLDGENLAQRLERTGPLGVNEACEIVRQVCLGLQVAHERHIVHRDIKPSNVMLVGTNGRICAKVMDLGLAQLREEISVQQALGDSEVFVGTFDYVAPEQVERTCEIDARADLYSLGCTFFHLLTGEAPYRRHYKTAMRKLIAHASAPIPRVDAFRSDVPAPIVELIARLMSKSPSDRPQSAREVAAVVELFANADASVIGNVGDRRPDADVRFHRTSPDVGVRTTELAKADSLPRSDHALRKASGRATQARFKVTALMLGMFLLAGILFRIQTDKGELEVEAFDEAVTIEASRDGQVEVLDTKTKTSVRLKSGEWQLRVVNRADIEVRDKVVQLKRDETVVAKLRFKPSVAANEKPDMPEPREPAPKIVPRVAPMIDPPAIAAASIRLDSTERLRRIVSGELTVPGVVAVLSEPASRETLSRQFPNALAYRPDGKWLAVGTMANQAKVEAGPGMIELLDAATGKTIRVWKAHSAAVYSLLWTSDGKRLLSGGCDGKVAITDVESGVVVDEISCDAGRNVGLALDADGKRLAVSSGKFVRLVDLASLTVTQRLEAESGLIDNLAFIDSQTLVSHGFHDSPNHVWTLGSGQPMLRTKAMHSHHLMRGLATSREQPHVVWTSGYDGQCLQWDVRTFEVKRSLKHQWVTASVSLSPDDRLLATSEWNGPVWLWNAATGERQGAITAMHWHSTVQFHPQGKQLAVASMNQAIRVVDVVSGEPIWPKAPHQEAVVRLAISPDERWLASAAKDGSVMLWDATAQSKTDTSTAPTGNKNSTAGDARRNASERATQPKHRLRHWGGVANSIEFRDEGQRLIAVTNESYITSWKLSDLSVSPAPDSKADPLRGDQFLAADATNIRTLCSAIDDAGRRVALGRLGDVIDIWDIEAKKPVRRLTGVPSGVRSLAFSADARWLWTIHNGNVLRWDLSVEQPPQRLELGSKSKAKTLCRVGSQVVIADEANIVRGFDSEPIKAEDAAVDKPADAIESKWEFQALVPIDRLRSVGAHVLTISTSTNKYTRWDVSQPTPQQLASGPLVPADLEAPTQDFAIAPASGRSFTAHSANCVIVSEPR